MLGLHCSQFPYCDQWKWRQALDLCLALGNYPSCRMPQKSSANSKPLTRKETRELDVKIAFLEGLVRRDPEFVEALQLLGDHYAQRGSLTTA